MYFDFGGKGPTPHTTLHPVLLMVMIVNGKLKEVSTEVRALDALVSEKKITWNKSKRETSKRETDFYQIIEGAANSSYRRKERSEGQR